MIDTVTLINGKPRGYISSKEFAESIGVQQVTIRMWIRREKLEAIKVGNGWFIRIGTPRPEEKRRGRKKKK